MGGHVRLALPGEAAAVARLQRDAWAQPDHPGHAMAPEIDLDELAGVWERSIVRPPVASARVLVAVSDQEVVGFVAVAPSDDRDAVATDGLVTELVVAPGADRDGHLSRLVQAAVDTMRADGFTTAYWWVVATDDALRAHLRDSGWAPDGAHAVLRGDDGEVRVRLVRLHTDIREHRPAPDA